MVLFRHERTVNLGGTGGTGGASRIHVENHGLNSSTLVPPIAHLLEP